MYKLGIDVGGTNTDAVLIDESLNVLCEVKIPTTADVYSGILKAVDTILEKAGVERTSITKAMLGTTQCTNAIVERKHLAPVAIIRIGAPATTGIRPMTDWAPDLKRVASAVTVIGGGFEYDGKRLAALDTVAARTFFESLAGQVESVAISSVFSTVRADDEEEIAAICREVMGEAAYVSISSNIGSMGLIERENATILNAALHQVSRSFTEGFSASLAARGLSEAELYISQNDGTLMNIETARQYPVLTIACGPTNSIRGAGYLSGLTDAVVVDIGGTTTDIGILQSGFPRESSVAVTIGGVRTNFRMPDVISIGLGGGSIVRQHADGSVTVGPDSVGYAIEEKALVFGGDVLTATDIVVKLGLVSLGDPSRVALVDRELAEKAMAVIREMIEDNIAAIKTSEDDVDVVLVGGGAILVPETLAGAGRIIRPDHYHIANAIGSSIAKVSGTWEQLFDYNEVARDDAIAQAKEAAVDIAVAAGAVRETVEIVDIEDVPLSYHPGHTCRVKIKAAGNLA